MEEKNKQLQELQNKNTYLMDQMNKIIEYDETFDKNKIQTINQNKIQTQNQNPNSKSNPNNKSNSK